MITEKNKTLVLISICGICFILIYLVNTNILGIIKNLEKEIVKTEKNIDERLQLISAGITFEQERTRILLQLRDIIQYENSSLDSAQAFTLSKNIINYCDKYNRIDPLLLLSLQKVESNFKVDAKSNKGAIGLNQIWPSTGRSLCRILGWEYDERILYDYDKNTKLACVLLDILYTQYDNDIGLILSDYNGGPLNAYYYKTDDKNIKNETKNYVEKVLTFYENVKVKISEQNEL